MDSERLNLLATGRRPARRRRKHAAPTSKGAQKIGGVAGWIDDRTGAASGVNYLLKKVFPDHWSFMLGEIAMYSMIVCLLSGTFLTFWFVPSAGEVVYHGSYVPLQGVTMSEAYQLDAGHLLRHPRRPAHPADPPLGRAHVHRRGVGAHVPRLLHRCVPQAA